MIMAICSTVALLNGRIEMDLFAALLMVSIGEVAIELHYVAKIIGYLS